MIFDRWAANWAFSTRPVDRWFAVLTRPASSSSKTSSSSDALAPAPLSRHEKRFKTQFPKTLGTTARIYGTHCDVEVQVPYQERVDQTVEKKEIMEKKGGGDNAASSRKECIQ